MKGKIRYKKVIIDCLLIFIGLFLVLRFVKIKFIDPGREFFISQDITEIGEEYEEYSFSNQTGTLSQTFEVTTDILWGVQLQFLRQQENPEGDIRIALTNDQEQVVYDQKVPISTIEDGKLYQIIFDHIEQDTMGKQYQLNLQVTDMNSEDTLRIRYKQDQTEVVGELKDDTGVVEGNLHLGQVYGQNTYLNKVFGVFAVLIALLCYGLYVVVFIKKCKIETTFLLVMLLTGFVYSLLLKPGSVPDEHSHYRSAYAYSNLLLGKGDGFNKPVMMDEEDYTLYQNMLDREPSVKTYQQMSEKLLRSASSTKMMPIESYPTSAPFYLYAASTLGITVGRVLNVNGLTAFYLGRVFNLLMFAGLAFWAMKKLPFYKIALFSICMLPMTAHLAGSISYDSIILGVALVLVSQILAFAYGKEANAKPKNLIIIATSCILLGACKGGAYIPICGLLLLIPQKRFSNRKKQILFIGGTLLMVLLFFSVTGLSVVSSSLGNEVLGGVGDPAYTIGWIFTNPGGFIQLLSNTMFVYGDAIINSLVGRPLGWLNVPVQLLVVLGFMGVFLLSAIHVTAEREAVVLNNKQKYGLLVCIVLSIAVVAAAMMLSWTPASRPYIEGIQGRYFIPLLLPFVLCLKNRTLVLQKSIDRGLIVTLGWLHVLTFVNVLAASFATLV